MTTTHALLRVIEHVGDSPLTLLLDYDGTLVAIAHRPELAAPDSELLGLLTSLSARPHTAVHLVSGRPKVTLQDWFGELPITLWAEHGFWHRPFPGTTWEPMATPPSNWRPIVVPTLQRYTDHTPGSFIEEKSAALAWHYRIAEPELGTRRAHKLKIELGELLRDQPFEILDGKKVIEVRMRGVDKAMVSRRVTAEQEPSNRVIAIGDDRTDEDLFRALPDTSVTIAVGPGSAYARYFVDDHNDARLLLQTLLTSSRV